MPYLTSVYEATFGMEFLYTLLQERTPEQTIDFKMPTWDEHKNYVNARPYKAWYLIYRSAEPIGHITLSHDREVGIFIKRSETRHGVGLSALQDLLDRHPGPLIARVNPANIHSNKFFEKAGFTHRYNLWGK